MIRRDPREALAAKAGTGVARLGPDLWLVTEPIATGRLLGSPDAVTARARQPPGLTSWGPDGTAAWTAVRRAMRPVLTTAHTTPLLPAVAERTRRTAARWPGVIDGMREAVRLVSDANLHHLLGAPSATLSALVEAELSAADGVLPGRLRRAQRATYDAIRAHNHGPLPALLAAQGFDEHHVTLAVRAMLLSGHHVPAAALAWAFHELARHPDAQDRVRAEADGNPERPYCASLIREALRLHPPVWQLRRQLRASVHGLPAGATVVFSPYLNHRNPAAHADPLDFRPERWLRHARPVPGSYFPFALGPRICPASRTAPVVLTTILGEVLRTHRLVRHRDPKPARGVLHAPRGLALRVVRTHR
ncbi:cytochrome P450 [Actinosynnema sp. NPDC004786]